MSAFDEAEMSLGHLGFNREFELATCAAHVGSKISQEVTLGDHVYCVRVDHWLSSHLEGKTSA